MTDPEPTDHNPGFIGRRRTRRVTCDWLVPEEGSPALWADVYADLPFGVLDAIPFGQGHTYRELWGAIAGHVLAWNVLGWDATTGERVPVPPPAEAGPDVFQWVDPVIADWLGFVLKTTYRNIASDDQKKASVPGRSPENAPASGSSAPANASRRNRTASPSGSGST